MQKKEKDKKGTVKALAILGIWLAIMGGAILYSHGIVGIAAQKSPVDLYADDTDILDLAKTTNLEAEIYMTLDYFATETTTTTRDGNFVSQDVDHYFIIPAFSGDDVYFIGIRVKAGDVRTFTTISDETYAYIMGDTADFGMTTIHEQGVLRDMDDEMYQYFTEWFEEAQWFEDESEIARYVLPIYLDPQNMANSRIFFWVGLVLAVAGIIVLVLALVKHFKNEKEVEENSGLVLKIIACPKDALGDINLKVQQNEKETAAQELSQLAGITASEAKEVIDNWNYYYRQV